MKINSFEEFIKKLCSKKVRHSTDTTEDNPKEANSWIEKWETEQSIKRDSLNNCPCCGKLIPQDSNNLYWVGAHVEDKQGSKYITPTCNECNDTYKNGKAEEKWFDVNASHLCPLH